LLLVHLITVIPPISIIDGDNLVNLIFDFTGDRLPEMLLFQ
jgi:hypothetical protein